MPTLFAEAKALWSTEALALSPADFQLRLDALLRRTDGLRILWQLGGATNDYLRRHPNSITVPQDLPIQLLSSTRMDARVIGLKLLVRLAFPLPVILQWIQSALHSSREDEVIGGLHELGNLLEQSDLPLSDRESVREQLKTLGNSPDDIIRESALRLIADDRLA